MSQENECTWITVEQPRPPRELVQAGFRLLQGCRKAVHCPLLCLGQEADYQVVLLPPTHDTCSPCATPGCSQASGGSPAGRETLVITLSNAILVLTTVSDSGRTGKAGRIAWREIMGTGIRVSSGRMVSCSTAQNNPNQQKVKA